MAKKFARRELAQLLWQRLSAPSSTFIVLQLLVIVPFLEYGLHRPAIIHYYLGDAVGNYAGLFALIWLGSSAFLAVNSGPWRLIRLGLLVTAAIYYGLCFPYIIVSAALVLGLIYLVSLDRKGVLIANSVVLIAGILLLLYAVFGFQSQSVKIQLTKPVNTIVLVFDEFSLEQVGGYGLLEDKARFPNFSELIATSDIYYNAVANNANTERAVPAIVAGRHANALGGGNYGGSSLLDPFRNSHRSHVVELVSTYNRQFDGSFWGRTKALFRHYLKSVYRQPRVDEISDLASIAARPERFSVDRSGMLSSELAGNGSSEARPFFYFHHLLVPHRPYQWIGDGFYNQSEVADRLFHDEFDENSNSHKNMLNQRLRYLDQLTRADTELGRMVVALKSAGLFDNTAILLTSDHGISFTPGNAARTPGGGNAAPIQFVPLIVKNVGQTKRRDIFEPISNLAVHGLALKANGASYPSPDGFLATGYRCFGLFNCALEPRLPDLAGGPAEYEDRVRREGALIASGIMPSLSQATREGAIAEDAAAFVEVEVGAGNLDAVTGEPTYYPYNFVLSIKGGVPLGKELIAYVNGQPCGSVEIDKELEKYSVYCSLPFPKSASHVDFYLFDGLDLSYLPKKLGYSHFSSSPWSGAWKELCNSAPPSYASPFARHKIYLSAGHREVVFVDPKTGNVVQRVSYPRDFEFDAVHLYDVNFLLTSKRPGQVLVFGYQS